MSDRAPRERRRRAPVGAAVLLLALAGCGDTGGPQKTSRVVGTVEIADIKDVGIDQEQQKVSCSGRGPYAGVHEGARVRVEDASGSVVSTGRLGQGRPVFDPRDLQQGNPEEAKPQSCLLGFVVTGVPPVGASWSVRIGTHRFDLPPDQTDNLALSLGES